MINDAIKTKEQIVTGNDNIVIVKHIAGLPGGRTLDVSAWNEPVINAGHVIVRDKDGVYKPLGVTAATETEAAKYNAKEETDVYAGILVATISKKNPEAAIMIEGVVNKAVMEVALPADFNLPIIGIEDETA